MPVIFKAVAFGPTGESGSTGSSRSERLDSTFFVHAKYRRMGGRSQIKANDLSGLGFKERIVALHVATHAVRAQPGAAPDASHPHMIKAKLLCQLARAPVGGSIAGGRRVQSKIHAAKVALSLCAARPR